MFTDMENWAEIRRRVLVDGLGKRTACREFDIHWDTLTKVLAIPSPPGYRRAAPRPAQARPLPPRHPPVPRRWAQAQNVSGGLRLKPALLLDLRRRRLHLDARL